MVQQVVLQFGPKMSNGAPVARANVRHSFNISNEKTKIAKNGPASIASGADCSVTVGRSDMR